MSDAELQKEEIVKSRPPKLSAERALPKSSAEQLVKIIKGYAVASNGGDSQVNYKDVASAPGIPPTVVSMNNAFLEEVQILASPKYGYYLPNEGAVRFAREAAWDEASAKAHLRKIISNCWYGQVTVQNLTLRSTLTREELKRSLAIKCGATEGDANALGFLIDFIVYTNLATAEENGAITRGNFDELISRPETAVWPELAVAAGQSATVEPRTSDVGKGDKKSSLVVIHFHVHDFTHLTPENAGALRTWVKLVNQEGLSVDFDFSGGNKSSVEP